MMYRFILFCLSLFISTTAYADPVFPDRDRRAVVDDAHVMSDATRTSLNQKLVAWNKRTQHQLVVVTVPTLGDYDIKTYGYQLVRKWKLGRTGIDDAAAIIFVPSIKTVRIENAIGFEPVLTDAISKDIIHTVMIPKLKAGQIDDALSSGSDAIMTYVDAHEKDIMVRQVSPVKHGGHFFAWLIFLSGVTVLGGALWYRRKLKKDTDPKTYLDKNLETSPTQVYLGRPYSTYRPHPPYTSYTPKYTSDTDTSSSSSDFLSGVAAGIAAEEITKRRDDDTSSYDSTPTPSYDPPADTGFDSSNDDWNNASGGGADESY